MSKRRFRVAQWGTGHTGMRALKHLIQRGNYELVGLRVYSDSKAGRDAGDICGLPETGVKATQSVGDIIAARPDCVSYMPQTDNYDIADMCKLLENGVNICTLCAEWHYRDNINPEDRQLLEAACEKGQSSLYAAGPSPGFATELLPMAVSTLIHRLDRFRIHEFADMRSRSTKEMISWMFGWKPGERDISGVAEHLRVNFGDSFFQTAETFGLPLDEMTVTGEEVACATQDITLAGYTIKKGSVAAWQFEVTGWRDGKPFMVFGNTWYATPHLDKPWETRDTGWRFTFDGDPPMELDLFFDRENFVASQPSTSAAPVTNAIPYVVEARPGILHTIDMPIPVPRYG